MNAKVEEFIEEQKNIRRKQELQERNKFLIKVGLIDEDKSTIKYSTDETEECYIYDKDRDLYSNGGSSVPIEVTDEEFAEICKYYVPDEVDKIDQRPKSAKLLRTMSTIILVLGLISAVVLFFVIAANGNTDFDPISFVYLISISLTSIITYAFGIAVSDIVTNTSKSK